LAGALAKVWQRTIDRLQFTGYGIAQFLVGTNASISERIERLLALPHPAKAMPLAGKAFPNFNPSVRVIFLILAATNVALVLVSPGCSSTVLF
jgi:hypothetical protein